MSARRLSDSEVGHRRQLLSWLLIACLAILLVVGLLQTLGLVRLHLTSASIQIVAIARGQTLLIDGTSDLVDGAILSCESWHVTPAGEPDITFTSATPVLVTGGRFECRLNLTDWPAGLVRTNVRFRPYLPEQPDGVRRLDGARGEDLGGSQVASDSDGWSVEAWADVSYGG